MISGKVLVQNRLGLHARPANIFVKECNRYTCDIFILHQEKKTNAKSMLGVLSACIKCGCEIELLCDGEDEANALSELTKLIESGLPD